MKLFFILVFIFFISCDNKDKDDTIDNLIGDDATLVDLSSSSGTFTPEFDPNVYGYSLDVSEDDSIVTISAIAKNNLATITLNDSSSSNASISVPVNLGFGVTNVLITVTVGDTVTPRVYTIIITRNLVNTTILEITGSWDGTDNISQVSYVFSNAAWSTARTSQGLVGSGTVTRFDNAANSMIINIVAHTNFTLIGNYYKATWTPSNPSDSSGTVINLTVYNASSTASGAEAETSVLFTESAFTKD